MENVNYIIIINGTTTAYSPEQVEDRFREEIYDIVKHVLSFKGGRFDGKIHTQSAEQGIPSIGYYDKLEYNRVRKRVAWVIFEREITSQFIELGERIKVYDRAINALTSAKLGLFGDTNQVKETVSSLKTQREALIEILNGAKKRYNLCNSQTFEEHKFDEIPSDSKLPLTEKADKILAMFEGVYILDVEPKHNKDGVSS
jgi:hypothetical protein